MQETNRKMLDYFGTITAPANADAARLEGFKSNNRVMLSKAIIPIPKHVYLGIETTSLE